MPYNKKQLILLISSTSLITITPLASKADFIQESSASFNATNIYLHRDYRSDSGQNKRAEWGQGLRFEFNSGFTEGSLGFGLDAIAALGIKLDSSPDRTNTGLLPIKSDGHAADEYSRLGLTAKTKFSATELRYGAHIPKLPVAVASTSRLLPQVFEGTSLLSKEIDNLSINAARFNRVIERTETGEDRLFLTNGSQRFTNTTITAKHMDLAGFDYQIDKEHMLRYWVSELKDIYRQHFFSLLGKEPLGNGNVQYDFRLFISKDSGKNKAGKIDNRAFNALVSYELSGHKGTVGFQNMSGKTAMPYIGVDPYLVNLVQISGFHDAGERSWQVRYDYDFASLGLPGLTFMARYLRGSGGRSNVVSGRGKEWERNLDLKYTVQEGVLKGFSVRLRDASLRSRFARDTDESRIILEYNKAIW